MQTTQMGWLIRLVFFLSLVLGGLSQSDSDYEHEYEELSGDGLGFPNFIPNCDKLLLLQTIDGKIHAIDRDNGRALWGEKAIQLNKDWFPKVNKLLLLNISVIFFIDVSG